MKIAGRASTPFVKLYGNNTWGRLIEDKLAGNPAANLAGCDTFLAAVAVARAEFVPDAVEMARKGDLSGFKRKLTAIELSIGSYARKRVAPEKLEVAVAHGQSALRAALLEALGALGFTKHPTKAEAVRRRAGPLATRRLLGNEQRQIHASPAVGRYTTAIPGARRPQARAPHGQSTPETPGVPLPVPLDAVVPGVRQCTAPPPGFTGAPFEAVVGDGRKVEGLPLWGRGDDLWPPGMWRDPSHRQFAVLPLPRQG